jgi:hypothetical protein
MRRSRVILTRKILALIRRQNGQLGWHQIAIAVGAVTVEERSKVLADLGLLEYSGVIRREEIRGRSLYWVGGVASQLSRRSD